MSIMYIHFLSNCFHLLINCSSKLIGGSHLFGVDHLRGCSHAVDTLVHDWHHVTLDVC